jgi:hypothetical protein
MEGRGGESCSYMIGKWGGGGVVERGKYGEEGMGGSPIRIPVGCSPTSFIHGSGCGKGTWV